MKRRELRIALCVLIGTIAVSGVGVSVKATQVSQVLPAAGVGLALEEGTSVDALERVVLTDPEVATAAVPQIASVAENATESAVMNTAATVEKTAEDTEPASEDAAADTLEAESAEEEDTEESDEYGNLLIAQVNDWVNVRKIPSTDGEIVGKMYNNSVGEVIRVEGDWSYITSGTISGYVKTEYFVTGMEAAAMVDSVSVKKATVMATTLNMRREPTTETGILMTLPLGDVIDVTNTNAADGWVEVNVNDTIGYVSADYVTINVEFISAESIEEEAARLAQEAAEQAERDRLTAEAAAAAAASSETTVAETPVVVSVPSSGTGSEVANFALQFVGNPYVYGGTSLTNGADCSGFVLAVYAHFGVSLPHSAHADRSMGTAVASLAEAQPGDLVCYPGHVGIYIGNGQIVHASTQRTGIKISDANYRGIVCIRRIFN